MFKVVNMSFDDLFFVRSFRTQTYLYVIWSSVCTLRATTFGSGGRTSIVNTPYDEVMLNRFRK